MNQKLLAEALYLFHRLEKLMREQGAQGTSFSDLVKSFNPSESEEAKKELASCREFVESVDQSRYYYDHQSDTHKLKDYVYDVDPDEVKRYNRCKKMIRTFYEIQEDLLGGMYPTLKVIGHERNQLLHIYNYQIENFARFKKACLQMISYFERGTLPPESKRVYLKELKKRQRQFTASGESTVEEGFSIFWIWIVLYVFGVIGIYFMKHVTFVESMLYAIPAVFIVLVAIGFIIENIAGIITIGILGGGAYMYLYHENSSFSSNQNDIVTRPSSVCSDYYVHTDALNIRRAPKRNAPKNGVLHRNEKVCVIEKEGHWYYIRDKGWVWSAYLSSRPSSSPKKLQHKKEVKRKKVHAVKKKVIKTVYHCTAKGERASGWAEKIGMAQAKKEALHQCEIRREEAMPCRVTECYPVH